MLDIYFRVEFSVVLLVASRYEVVIFDQLEEEQQT
jgi:hypothetical protein